MLADTLAVKSPNIISIPGNHQELIKHDEATTEKAAQNETEFEIADVLGKFFSFPTFGRITFLARQLTHFDEITYSTNFRSFKNTPRIVMADQYLPHFFCHYIKILCSRG